MTQSNNTIKCKQHWANLLMSQDKTVYILLIAIAVFLEIISLEMRFSQDKWLTVVSQCQDSTQIIIMRLKSYELEQSFTTSSFKFNPQMM